ncbi:MAG: hypothetical protein CMJ58_11015 [Planctomycetaceae bacterium]|nr:hypothetical protein [Planctomycetaceae bacterium]
MTRRNVVPLFVALLIAVGMGAVARPAAAQNPIVTAGANLNIDFNQEIEIPFSGFAGQWFVAVDLMHDPAAGPMIKRLESPHDDTGQPILLDAQQRFALRIDEEFNIGSPGTAGIPVSVEVRDWHEEILTPGFNWVIPTDATIPQVFPDGTSLITRNGAPHPYELLASPAVLPPRLDVKFPPIYPGEVLDIHKAIEWVGTPGNRIWGDNMLDDGTPFDEGEIRVWEYPTVPEPATWGLMAITTLVGVSLLRRA